MPNSGSDAKILTFRDARTAADALAEFVVECAAESIDARGRFRLALSGGSTPLELHRRLALTDLASAIDWPSVHVFWGDERCVPIDDPASNFRMAVDSLLAHVPVLPSNVHAIDGTIEPNDAAAAYADAASLIVRSMACTLLGKTGTCARSESTAIGKVARRVVNWHAALVTPEHVNRGPVNRRSRVSEG